MLKSYQLYDWCCLVDINSSETLARPSRLQSLGIGGVHCAAVRNVSCVCVFFKKTRFFLPCEINRALLFVVVVDVFYLNVLMADGPQRVSVPIPPTTAGTFNMPIFIPIVGVGKRGEY